MVKFCLYGKILFIWLTAFLVSFFLCFFISIVLLDVFVRCDDHAPLYNLFNVTSKNLGMFNVNSFCHQLSFFTHCFYLIVEFFVLRKQKRNKLPTTKLLLPCTDGAPAMIGKNSGFAALLKTKVPDIIVIAA